MDDVLVIGAGASGMSCALALAKAGRSVRLVEKSPRTAPVIRGFNRGGHHFDCGFHYAGSLGRNELFSQILDYLGIYSNLDCIPLDPQGADVIRIEKPASQIPIPWGWERVEEGLLQRFPSETEGITRYLAMVREVFHDIPASFERLEDMGIDGLWDDGMGPSLKEVLDDVTDDPVLQSVLGAQSFLYGSSPAETPFVIHARVAGTHYQSLHGVRGGGSAVADAFDAALADLGVDVHVGTGVEQLDVDTAGAIRAVRLADGQALTAERYVFSGHPGSLASILPEPLRNGRMGKRIRRLEDTFSSHILFCAMDTAPQCLNMSNLIVQHNLNHEIIRGDVPIADRGFFASYCQPSGDAQTFTVIFPESHAVVDRWKESRFGRRGAEYERFKAEATACFMDRLVTGIPELKDKVRVVCAATPLTIKHYCNTPDTAGIYGVKHRCGQVPVLPKTRIPNLYMCGQAVVTPGLFGAVYSGLLTSAIMLGGNQLTKELFQ